MSSHHSQRFFDLHHKQVVAGRERKHARFMERLEFFREQRGSIQAGRRRDYLCGLFFTCLISLYVVVASIVYFNYIVGA